MSLQFATKKIKWFYQNYLSERGSSSLQIFRDLLADLVMNMNWMTKNKLSYIKLFEIKCELPLIITIFKDFRKSHVRLKGKNCCN